MEGEEVVKRQEGGEKGRKEGRKREGDGERERER